MLVLQDERGSWWCLRMTYRGQHAPWPPDIIRRVVFKRSRAPPTDVTAWGRETEEQKEGHQKKYEQAFLRKHTPKFFLKFDDKSNNAATVQKWTCRRCMVRKRMVTLDTAVLNMHEGASFLVPIFFLGKKHKHVSKNCKKRHKKNLCFYHHRLLPQSQSLFKAFAAHHLQCHPQDTPDWSLIQKNHWLVCSHFVFIFDNFKKTTCLHVLTWSQANAILISPPFAVVIFSSLGEVIEMRESRGAVFRK